MYNSSKVKARYTFVPRAVHSEYKARMIFDTRAPYWALEIGIAGFKVHTALAMRIGLLPRPTST